MLCTTNQVISRPLYSHGGLFKQGTWPSLLQGQCTARLPMYSQATSGGHLSKAIDPFGVWFRFGMSWPDKCWTKKLQSWFILSRNVMPLYSHCGHFGQGTWPSLLQGLCILAFWWVFENLNQWTSITQSAYVIACLDHAYIFMLLKVMLEHNPLFWEAANVEQMSKVSTISALLSFVPCWKMQRNLLYPLHYYIWDNKGS